MPKASWRTKRYRSHSSSKPPRLKNKLPADFSSKQFIADLRYAVGVESHFKNTYLLEEMCSKYVDPTTTPAKVRASAAIEKWLGTERRNLATNMRIALGDHDFGWIHSDFLIEEIRKVVSRVLGPLVYPEILQDSSYTNGASTRVRRSPSAASDKLVGIAEITEPALKHWLAAFCETKVSDQTLTFVKSSKLFTVPKTSDIDRVACKEPECNALLQRSVGNHIRRRLKSFGIDLRDQSINQELARVGVARKLATIDLSSASDSISRSLVMYLLPLEWWSLLDDLRVHTTTLPDGSVHTLNMFSSMGNGFTFELESLLFYAITRVVCRYSGQKGRISVYGDDIIAPSSIVPRLKRIFAWFGFKLNPKKTHHRGHFRESCGKHFYRGVDVTPFYIRRPVALVTDLILHLNHLLEWDGRGWGFFLTEEAYQVWKRYIKFVPKDLWGGIHPSDPTALVTGHNPRKRLSRCVKNTEFDEFGAFLLWLLTNRLDQRSRESVMDLDDPWLIPDVDGWDLDEWPSGQKSSLIPREPGFYQMVEFESLGERTTWFPGQIMRSPLS